MFVSYAAKRVVRPGPWRLGTAGCSLCVRMCTYVVIARTLGIQNFGILLFMQWFAALLLPLVGTGMTPLASSRIVELQFGETRSTLAGIFHLRWRQQCRRILLYCVIYTPLACLLTLLIGRAVPLSLLLMAGMAATPLLLSSIATTTLQGLRRYDLLAGLRLFSTLVNFCLVYIVLKGHGTMIGLLLLMPTLTSLLTLTVALICITYFLPLREGIEPGPLLQERIEQCQRPALPSFLVDSVVWRELLLLILLLTTQHTLSSFGFYIFSVLLCTHLIEIVPKLFITCMLPIKARLSTAQRSPNIYDAFMKTSYSLALLAGTICTLLSLFCPLIIEICFGKAYMPMVTLLRILLLGVAFASMATVSLTYLLNNKHEREQSRLGIGVATMHICLAIPCILLWGVVGAALASTVAHIASTLGTTILCHRFLARG